MKTAVQLREGPNVTGTLLAGTPEHIGPTRLGRVAVFTPGTVVAYLVRSPMGPSLTVFRTLAIDDPLAASVPGVAPRVRLLLFVRTAGRVRAVARLLHLLSTRGIDPSSLRDIFYVRVSVAVQGRVTDRVRLRALLRQEEESRTERVSPVGKS